jgi:uncharacterized protein (DUF58 family)
MIRRYHVRATGLVYGLLTVLIGLCAISTQNNLLFWIFGLLLAGVLLSGIVSGVMMMGVECRRLDPRFGAVGEPLVVGYEIRNRNRIFPIFNLTIEERKAGRSAGSSWSRLVSPAQAWVMHVGPQEFVHGEAVFWPVRRGEAQFHAVRVSTSFPFGLLGKSITFSQSQHTLIYPRMYELRRGVLSAVTPAGPMGTRVSSLPGAGDDYFGVREYRAGDSLRHVAWKRAAGTDQLISIERTRPSPPKLRVVLNLSQADAGAAETSHEPADVRELAMRELEEKAISLAASMVHAADRAGMEIGLSVLGLDVPPIPVRRSHWHVSRIMAALAAINLEQPRQAASRPVLNTLEPAGLVVIHREVIEPGVAPAGAWHLSARQLDSLAIGPIGWAPEKESDSAIARAAPAMAPMAEVAAR